MNRSFRISPLASVIAAGLIVAATSGVQAATLFSDNFDSGSISSPWLTGGTYDWRVITSTGYRYGSSGYGVRMDDSTSGGYSTSRLDLPIDLSNINNAELTFIFRSVGDELHAEDGLYLSTNGGSSFSRVTSWSVPSSSSSYVLQTVDLSAAASSLGTTLNSSTVIRWQQYDNYPIASDGWVIDNVTVTGTPAATNPVPTARGGMGPIPYETGTAFRVWAPNASSVAVAGDFNGWSTTANPLASEGNGNWSTDVEGAYINDKYKYVIVNGGNTLWKVDPRAQHVTNSVGESVIPDTSFDWGGGTSTLFSDDFEATTINPAWTVSGSGTYRTQLSTSYKASGSRGLTMDSTTNGTYATNQLTRVVNAAGYSNLTLNYTMRNVADEIHTSDGVYISNNGSSWTKVESIPSTGATYHPYSLDLSTAASNAGFTPGSTFYIRFQQYDNYALSTDGIALDDISLTGTSSGVSFAMPAWNELLIYEMHVGTLNDSPGGNPGNFNSAIARLDHVRDLGFNAVKVMPICEFGGDFSWGYNPAHPFAVESIYGGFREYKRFVKEAHARGIAVIQDVVYNHFGPSDLALWQFDGWSQNGKGGIYFYQDWRSSTPWGDTRPDYGRGEVRSYLRDNALMWLSEYQVDGLRWDSTVNIRTQNNGGGGDIGDGWSLMQYINNEIDAAYPWKISIAEDLQNNNYLTKTTGAGGAGFDSQWDSLFVHTIRDNVIVGDDGSRNMYSVRDAIAKIDNGNAFSRVIYTESHDEVNNGRSRVPEEIWPGNAGSWYSKKRSTLGAAAVFTSPGIPMIFQGQEILEDGFWSDTDPIDWSKLTTYGGINSMYSDLAKLRRNWYNNTRGLKGHGCNVFHVNNTNKVVAFHRYDQGGAGDDVIVVLNFGNTGYSSYNIGMPRGGTWYVRFNGDWNGYSSDFSNWNAYNTSANSGAKDGMGYNANIGIGPYTAIILSQ